MQRTRDGGAEILKYLGTGSAYCAPGAAVAEMLEAIFLSRNRILDCAASLEAKYRVNGLFMGVPCKINDCGVAEILEVQLTPQEREDFLKSAAAAKALAGRVEASLSQPAGRSFYILRGKARFATAARSSH